MHRSQFSRRVVALCWTISMLVALSCSGDALDPEADLPVLPDVPLADSVSQRPSQPDAFRGMWDPNPAFLGKRQLDGFLHIEHRCVYLLDHADRDAILIGLPREQTDYDAATASITVSGRGVVASGDRVTVIGNYDNRSHPSDLCPSDARFNAWQLDRSTDPFVGMYDHPEDAARPDYYRIGLLMIEPPCAFLVSRVNRTLTADAYDEYLVAEVLTLARNTTRYDPRTKSIQTRDHEPVTDGDAVVVIPGVSRENRYTRTCPGDTQRSSDTVIPADDVGFLSVEERQYVASLRRDASTMWTGRPCERLGVCPMT